MSRGRRFEWMVRDLQTAGPRLRQVAEWISNSGSLGLAPVSPSWQRSIRRTRALLPAPTSLDKEG